MKTKIIGISIIVVLMTSLVIAQDVLEKPTLWEKIKGTFREIMNVDYSIVGEARHCDVDPRYDWEITPDDGTFTKDASDYCPSGHGLFNTYTDWTPKSEYKDCLGGNCYGIACGDLNDACQIELYCCPHPECTSDNQCEDWEGEGSECKTSTADDPYIDLKYSSWSYCTEKCTGEDIICWQLQSSGECISRDYSCGYETYPNCPSGWYDTKSECEASGEEDENGEDEENGEDDEDEEDETHNMAEITNMEISKTKLGQKETLTVSGTIKNNLDTSKTYLLELGIIPFSVGENWFAITSSDIKREETKWWEWALIIEKLNPLFATYEHEPETQCCLEQENIEDYSVTLEAGEEYDFSFTVKAPYKDIEDKCGDADYWVGQGDYLVYTFLTTDCYPDGIGQGVSFSRIEISEGEYESRQSLTKNEWEDAVAFDEWDKIISSMCTSTSQCSKIEGYDIECKKSEEIWDVNYDAAKENYGEFISQIPNMMGVGILPEKFADIGVTIGGWFIEYKEDIPRGTCRASKEGESSICKFIEDNNLAFFEITEDECTDGMIILIGGVLLLLIIFSRLSGIYGEIENEKN